MTKDTAYTQIYKRRSADSLTSVSEVSHKANMTPMLSSDYKSRVKARAEEAEREKKSRKIALIDDPLGPSSNMKSSRTLNSNTKRTSGSPTTGAMHSPVVVSSPGNDVSRAPSISSSLRERVIQLLALKPFKLSLLANMVKASEKDLMRMIRKVNCSWMQDDRKKFDHNQCHLGCQFDRRHLDAEIRYL
jgi:RNA polymerase II elongation factor ELL